MVQDDGFEEEFEWKWGGESVRLGRSLDLAGVEKLGGKVVTIYLANEKWRPIKRFCARSVDSEILENMNDRLDFGCCSIRRAFVTFLLIVSLFGLFGGLVLLTWTVFPKYLPDWGAILVVCGAWAGVTVGGLAFWALWTKVCPWSRRHDVGVDENAESIWMQQKEEKQ